jgi:hypothetical protein
MTLGGQSSRREAWPSGFGPANELPLDNGEIRLPIGLGSGRYLMAIHINRRDHVANHGATYSAVVEVE